MLVERRRFKAPRKASVSLGCLDRVCSKRSPGMVRMRTCSCFVMHRMVHLFNETKACADLVVRHWSGKRVSVMSTDVARALSLQLVQCLHQTVKD
jgi:hypothetical protein